MKTKIKSLTIVNKTGIKSYLVGKKYNGLILHRIENWSIEYPDAFHTYYKGFSIEDGCIFEAINAPIEVEYEPVKI